MRVVIIRHAESTKNILNKFSGDENNEPLTKKGEQQADYCGRIIKKYIEDNNISDFKIYCAKSRRAISTANIICEICKTIYFESDNLKSFQINNQLVGINRDELKQINKKFFYDLMCYEKGMKNLYDIVWGGNKNALKEFEKKVSNTINKIIVESNSKLVLIVMHKSAAMAYFVYLARKYLNYPKNYYGLIPIDNANIFSFVKQDDIVDIDIINEKIDILLGKDVY